MKAKFKILVVLFFSATVSAQEIDTLNFYSDSFNEMRQVFIHKPIFYKYKSDSVQLPVIYLLDGQHEWFVNPLLSDINYLQYTHEIPNAIVVVIPFKDRNKECSIPNLKSNTALDRFITEELDTKLEQYNPSGFKMIIGHSFSSSFSLYSYLNHPNYYSAVIAHSPMDNFEKMVDLFEQNSNINKSNISISIGGIAAGKDYYHRKNYDQVKNKFPSFFKLITT
ncbi:esterase family protein [Crocinitomix sp.]|nr:esterase family protein [Crocinitomix sp.]